jgi:hypothetical protein
MDDEFKEEAGAAGAAAENVLLERVRAWLGSHPDATLEAIMGEFQLTGEDVKLLLSSELARRLADQQARDQ